MIDFERERQWWDHKAHKEEVDRDDEVINRALRWREIEKHLDGIATILEIGGATGAFSIPLARRGFQVTHLDFSPAMLAIAREKAQGLETIRFVEGNAVDLSCFADVSFDLVLNMDGAISFCGDRAEQAVREACRVTKKCLIVAVSHRAHILPAWVDTSMRSLGHLSDAVYAMLREGQWHQDQFAENAAQSRGATDDYLGAIQAFLPDELAVLLSGCGLRVLRCGGLGSLAGQCRPETLQQITSQPEQFEAFLDLCETYDREFLPDGPGTRQRAGLLAVAEKV